MNDQERAKMIELFKEATKIKATYDPHPYAGPFNDGMKWGIKKTMKALGFSFKELLDMENEAEEEVKT